MNIVLNYYANYASMSFTQNSAKLLWQKDFICLLLTTAPKESVGFSSVQFSHSVVSNSLRPHESQHAQWA